MHNNRCGRKGALLTIIVLISISGDCASWGASEDTKQTSQEAGVLVHPYIIVMGKGNKGYETSLSKADTDIIRKEASNNYAFHAAIAIDGEVKRIWKYPGFANTHNVLSLDIPPGHHVIQYVGAINVPLTAGMFDTYSIIETWEREIYNHEVHVIIINTSKREAVMKKLPHSYNSTTGEATHPTDSRFSFNTDFQE